MPADAYASRAWRALCARAYVVYGYHCYWCGVDIDPGLPATDRWSKTVDHLNPVRDFGAGLPDIQDVRPMHRRCNSQRAASLQVRTGVHTPVRYSVAERTRSPHW